jgi:hypothetical protein
VATAFGVPLGTLVGQALGWRGAFAAVLVLALPVTAAIAFAVPAVPGTGGAAAGQARCGRSPDPILAAVPSELVTAVFCDSLEVYRADWTRCWRISVDLERAPAPSVLMRPTPRTAARSGETV